ncbi:MAG: dihydropyrimidinase [Alphaproteobacteria bacterium]
MAAFDLVVRNGTVATAADTVSCDIGIRDGRIVALADGLAPGAEEIDAAGLLVLPGGIDSHCHLDQQAYWGVEPADDFRSGSISAACGGNTTIIPFAMPLRGQSLRAVVEDYHRRAETKAIIDYAFHLIVAEAGDQIIGQELPALIKDGYTSFKIYLTYDDLKLDDAETLQVLDVARREGAMTMVHAENDDCIRWLTEQLLAAGRTAPKHHADAHPAPVEREATQRAITLAEVIGAPVLIVHVSSAEAIAEIRRARNRGICVYGETCPQYLFLTADDMDRAGFEGAKYMCTPPPRDAANQEIVWRALAGGVFQVYSSDHAPYRYADPRGKMCHGEDAPFPKIPQGVPGIEARLPLLFSEGVGKGRIDLNAFVALSATNAAKIYGLYPRKGTIAVGSDADIAIWDPARRVTIGHEMLHDNLDYTPYEGRTVTGWPTITIARGEVVWRDGEVLGAPGRGRFLRCDPIPAPKPGAPFGAPHPGRAPPR